MKNKILFYAKIMLCLILISGQHPSLAQTQSMQLPIPSENASVINFSDPAAPVITTLPAHEFRIGGPTGAFGNSHNEDNLRDAFPSMFEYYLGQHPKYAQSVVHDNNGDLLFFIVDNNIYNRRGNFA